MPNPRKTEAHRLISSSLIRVLSLALFRDTTKMKNQAVKKVPMTRSTVARWGKTAGFTGET